jgi:hypothetical protein
MTDKLTGDFAISPEMEEKLKRTIIHVSAFEIYALTVAAGGAQAATLACISAVNHVSQDNQEAANNDIERAITRLEDSLNLTRRLFDHLASKIGQAS